MERPRHELSTEPPFVPECASLLVERNGSEVHHKGVTDYFSICHLTMCSAYTNHAIHLLLYTNILPRRVDARLGSTRARTHRGHRQSEAANATQYRQGVLSKVNRV